MLLTFVYIFGFLNTIYYFYIMEFKHILNDMIKEGWRVYRMDTLPPTGKLDNLCHAKNLQMFTYENTTYLFVKNKYKKET